ncbi:MAG: protein phosphatase 2C domain-containing protein [Gemmataceae bacterium]|nr:protein phosphatase 2C domain-containing protein [Gemmataceae bacterium]
MIRTYAFSAAGGHAVNEDAFALHLLPAEGDAYLVALADGQGGRSGGARAAQLVCRVVRERADEVESLGWPAVLALADAEVAADPQAGFTTLVGLSVRAERVTGASCGDSAAVAVCGANAPRVLTSRQFKNPPVGSGEADFIPFELALTLPWKVLLMSDGVWKYASWDTVWNCTTRLSGVELLDALQVAARLPATSEFPDDFTVVLLESE